MQVPWRRREIIGDCVLYLGDCREIMPEIGAVDALITDPPYGVNLGRHRGAQDTRKGVLRKSGYSVYEDTPENFRNIVVPAVEKALSISKRAAIWMAGSNAWLLPKPSAIGGVYMPNGMGRNSWGFCCLHICLFYGTAPELSSRGARATAFYSADTAIPNGHPCPKPLRWMLRIVDLASLRGETVLDPFMGSGTTGVACIKLGRKFIGIEIDPVYFEIACRMIDEAARQPDMFLNDPKPEQISMEFSK